MKSKKMVSLTLAAATSAALLAGCGSSNTANQAASTASTQAAAETSTAAAATSEAADTAATTAAASGDVQKIVVYRAAYNVADPDTDEVTKVQDAINQYLLEKGHNVQVEIGGLPSEPMISTRTNPRMISRICFPARTFTTQFRNPTGQAAAMTDATIMFRSTRKAPRDTRSRCCSPIWMRSA